MNNTMCLKSITELFHYNFYIGNYQRGYRWEKEQVTQLLEDIYNYFNQDLKDSFYCLQPIVVRKLNKENINDNSFREYLNANTQDNFDNWYEVIDGQQRLTTIKIIYTILSQINLIFQKTKYFNIYYQTRADLVSFFNKIKIETIFNDKFELSLHEIEQTNIDSRYIFNAAQTVTKWMNENRSKALTFCYHFLNDNLNNKSIKVIWYEEQEKDPRDIFNELNDLSVKLSCSELIRSLFLSDVTFSKTLTKGNLNEFDIKNKQIYINSKWNEIESKLSQKRVLSFVSNSNSKTYRNNIEILFNLIAKKDADLKTKIDMLNIDDVIEEFKFNKKDPFYTFFVFQKLIEQSFIKDNSLSFYDVWILVEKYFSNICAYIEDRDYYHFIGYIVALSKDDSAFIDIIDKSLTMTKSEFKNYLIGTIYNLTFTKYNIKDIESIKYLNYEENYACIKEILFLYNVELHRHNNKIGFFPFEHFKPLKKWTLEHIHAQNSDLLPNNKDIWLKFFEYNLSTLDSLNLEILNLEIPKFLNTDLKDLVNKKSYEELKELFDEIALIYSKINNSDGNIHNISNLTLLDGSTNSAISCSSFAVKRLEILECITSNTSYFNNEQNESPYIPIATQNIFTKSYLLKTEKEKGTQQLFSWSNFDRDAYLKSLTNILSFYNK